jgi:phosphoribosylformylglycinamidine synthase I
MTVGILRFLGTNCDRDVAAAVEAMGGQSRYLWFEDQFEPKDLDTVIVPGGFSYGDYLRCGALAAKAPAMQSVAAAAARGTPVLGICNGFQILCEANLLPGALLRNEGGRFIDRWVSLNTVSANPHFATPAVCRLPIAHGEGRFVLAPSELKRLHDSQQVWLTYAENPNGSMADIAGITNTTKNVAALMPHPERAMAQWMGTADGRSFFERVVQ